MTLGVVIFWEIWWTSSKRLDKSRCFSETFDALQTTSHDRRRRTKTVHNRSYWALGAQAKTSQVKFFEIICMQWAYFLALVTYWLNLQGTNNTPFYRQTLPFQMKRNMCFIFKYLLTSLISKREVTTSSFILAHVTSL